MSRIIRFHQFGPADVLRQEERAVPVAGPGEVLIGVRAVGVSWNDVLWRQDLAPRHARLWFNFGHAHQGFTLGPVSGRLMAELIEGGPTVVDPAPYAPTRFG